MCRFVKRLSIDKKKIKKCKTYLYSVNAVHRKYSPTFFGTCTKIISGQFSLSYLSKTQLYVLKANLEIDKKAKSTNGPKKVV